MEDTIADIESSSRRDKGFTLVELLIVIVILGILATVTVFAVRGITSQGQDSACAADEKMLQVAAEAYQAQNGSYPASVAVMVSDGLLTEATSNWQYTAPGVGSPAIPAVLDDPETPDVNEAAPAVPAVAAGTTYTLVGLGDCAA